MISSKNLMSSFIIKKGEIYIYLNITRINEKIFNYSSIDLIVLVIVYILDYFSLEMWAYENIGKNVEVQ